MVAALHSYTHRIWLRFWGTWSLVELKWCIFVKVDADSHLKMFHGSKLDINNCLRLLICCQLAYSSSLEYLYLHFTAASTTVSALSWKCWHFWFLQKLILKTSLLCHPNVSAKHGQHVANIVTLSAFFSRHMSCRVFDCRHVVRCVSNIVHEYHTYHTHAVSSSCFLLASVSKLSHTATSSCRTSLILWLVVVSLSRER